MPKVHTIRGFDALDSARTFDVSGSFARDVAEAVEREHDCDDSACDIRAALEQGFPFVAAFLLSGATETPLLDSVVAAHRFNGTARDDFRAEPFNARSGPNTAPRGWAEWCAWEAENARPCPSCNARNYGRDSDYGGGEMSCGSCGKGPLPLSLSALRDVVDDAAGDGFMQPEVWQGDFVEVDGPGGIDYVPTDAGRAAVELSALLSAGHEMGDDGCPMRALAQQATGSLFAPWSARLLRGAFAARFSAPGYLDATEVSVFETEREALEYLREECERFDDGGDD